MRVFLLIIWCTLLFQIHRAACQCPNRDTVLNEIKTINNSSAANYKEDLQKLKVYESGFRDCPSPVDSVYTILLLRIGVLYYKQAEYNLAIQYTRKAFDIIQKNAGNPAINKSGLVRYYFYLSIYYDSLRMPVEKNRAIDSCISNELRVNSNYQYTSQVLEDNVIDLYEKGDYNLCADRSALGEMLIHKYYQSSDSMSHVIFFIYYKASALRSLRRFAEEEQFLQSKKSEFLKSRNKDYVGIIYNLFGYLYESKGDYENAAQYFLKAYEFDRLSKKKEISSEVLSKAGEIYSEKFGQYPVALRYFYKALSCAQNKKLSGATVSDSFYIWGNIANVYVRMRNFDSSFYFFQKAFDRIRMGLNESDFTRDMENYVNANRVEEVIKLVLNKANAYLQQYYYTKNSGSLVKALAIYKTADHLLTKIKEGQAEIKSRLFWQTDAHILYEHAIEAAYLLGNVKEAFYFFEKSRAVLLNEQLTQQNKTSGENILKLSQIKRKILMLERERDTVDISSGHYIEIQKELIVSNQSLERLRYSMKNDNPLYYQNIMDTSFITIPRVQQEILKDHRALLEIFSGDSAIYSLLITQSKVYFSRIVKKDFDSSAKTFLSYLSNPVLLNKQFDRFIHTASHLYKLFFQNNPVPNGRIIISPDGQNLPFEALVTSTNASAPNYFLQEHAVSYTYSARYLLTQFATHTNNKQGNFLGVAPVHYGPGSTLASLQGSDLSLNRIGSYFTDANNLIAGNASRNNFQQQFSNYKIIQLYTHASDSSSQGEPVIYFADSALYLSDLIPENKPQTRLIVLSACETGTGKLYKGEGVFNFNRGFASMGIPAAITNLWSVDNKSTYRITELFYKNLSLGMPMDIALQKAKLTFIRDASKQEKLPYYWAATMLAGKTDHIDLGKNFPWLDILTILSLVGLSYAGFQKWNRKKKTFL